MCYYIDMNRDDIRNKIKINKRFWIHFKKTNCYAYALGLDVNENRIMKNAYQPGMIGNYQFHIDSSKKQLFTYDQLIEAIYTDMDKLGIDIYPIKWDTEISSDAWKIALFISYYSQNSNNLYDFHFLRLMNDSWYHKMSYHSLPNNKDDNMQIITNPDKCYLRNRVYKGSYCLKLK